MRHPPSKPRAKRSAPRDGFSTPPPPPRRPSDPRPDPVLEPDAFRAWAERDIAREQARRRPRGPRQPTQCTVSYCAYATGKCWVPLLRFRGKWLDAIGFAPGTKLSVEVRDGGLIVRPLKPSAPSPKAR